MEESKMDELLAVLDRIATALEGTKKVSEDLFETTKKTMQMGEKAQKSVDLIARLTKGNK